jgi:hypothetical protein
MQVSTWVSPRMFVAIVFSSGAIAQVQVLMRRREEAEPQGKRGDGGRAQPRTVHIQVTLRGKLADSISIKGPLPYLSLRR